MRRYIIEDNRHVPPFNEPASALTFGDQPLKLHQENLLAHYFGHECELGGVLTAVEQIDGVCDEAIVFRDNLWFDMAYLTFFMMAATHSGRACRAAISPDDPAFAAYTLPLAQDLLPVITSDGSRLYLADLWYFPDGYTADALPIVVPSDAQEMGFYSVPDFMTMQQGDLTHFAPMRAIASIESWVHVYFTTIIYGNFGRAGRMDRLIETRLFTSLRLLWRALVEQKQILSASGAVRIGKNCAIDPSAVITGPSEIGDNCSIGAGVVIDNCTIGSNVTIDAGCVLFQSTVGNNCFLPFRASLYMTAIMENSIVAQNTCLQMCVVGRNSFVGAGNTFTDFNLLAQKPIRAADRDGRLRDVGQIVLGSAVGHNCRIGSGLVIFPGRMVESDVVLVASPQRRVISRSVTFEESDHHMIPGGEVHRRFYPRLNESAGEDAW